MNNQELNTALYEKMFAEQDTYRKWLLTQPPEEILNHTYEYTIREDILLSLEYHDLTDAQAAALLKSPSPLADVFREFDNRQTDHMDQVFRAMEDRANDVLEAEAEKRRILRETPVYRYPAGQEGVCSGPAAGKALCPSKAENPAGEKCAEDFGAFQRAGALTNG